MPQRPLRCKGGVRCEHVAGVRIPPRSDRRTPCGWPTSARVVVYSMNLPSYSVDAHSQTPRPLQGMEASEKTATT